MFSALFELLTGNFLFFALHFDSRSVFPKPLSAKEERECFERMAQGDKAAKDKLIEHNLRLVAHIIKKYYSNSTDQEDLISIGTIGLIKAVSTFDHKKGCRHLWEQVRGERDTNALSLPEKVCQRYPL